MLNLDVRSWYEWTTNDILRGGTNSNGTFYAITDTQVVRYDESVSTDGGFNYQQVITTGWIKTGHMRGFQRLRRAYFEGAVSGATTLTLQVFTDYNQTTATQTVVYNLTTVDPLQIDLHLAVQKCEALQFKLTTNRGGLTLSGATLEVGTKQGPDKSRTSGTNK